MPVKAPRNMVAITAQFIAAARPYVGSNMNLLGDEAAMQLQGVGVAIFQHQQLGGKGNDLACLFHEADALARALEGNTALLGMVVDAGFEASDAALLQQHGCHGLAGCCAQIT